MWVRLKVSIAFEKIAELYELCIYEYCLCIYTNIYKRRLYVYTISVAASVPNQRDF